MNNLNFLKQRKTWCAPEEKTLLATWAQIIYGHMRATKQFGKSQHSQSLLLNLKKEKKDQVVCVDLREESESA